MDFMGCKEITRAAAVLVCLGLSVTAPAGARWPAAVAGEATPEIPHRRGRLAIAGDLADWTGPALVGYPDHWRQVRLVGRPAFHEELAERYGGVNLVVVALALSTIAALVAILAVQRHHRRRTDALLERLAELELKTGERVTAEGSPPGVGAAQGPGPEEGMRREDVLSGKTDTIRQLVLQDDAPADLVDRAIVYLHRHLRENLSAGRLAEDLHVSLRTLERSLASSLHCTPSNLILAVRMREASRLLRTGKWRVNEVAYHVGFSNPSHFSRRFKEYYRVPPSRLIKTAVPTRGRE